MAGDNAEAEDHVSLRPIRLIDRLYVSLDKTAPIIRHVFGVSKDLIRANTEQHLLLLQKALM
jgi:hypothetical protein